jgi:hypothetical protein
MKEQINKLLEKRKAYKSDIAHDTRELQHTCHESAEAGTFGEEKGKHNEKEDLY